MRRRRLCPFKGQNSRANTQASGKPVSHEQQTSSNPKPCTLRLRKNCLDNLSKTASLVEEKTASRLLNNASQLSRDQTPDRSIKRECPKNRHVQYARRRGAVSAHIWHERLGHLNKRDMRFLESPCATSVRTKLGTNVNDLCEPCVFGKITRAAFPSSSTKTSQPGELVFSDIKGPFQHAGVNGRWRYFVTYQPLHAIFEALPAAKKSDPLLSLKKYVATTFS